MSATAGRADAPHVYAIKGARLMTASGPPIASGTIVIRHGQIEAIGAGVQAPADAIAIDGAGLTVYPGLIDMGHPAGLDVGSTQPQPPNLRTTEDAERWKRSLIFRPELEAAGHLKETPELARLASSGITAVLATPPGVVFKGRSALVHVTAPPDEPQIGGVGDYRQGVQIVPSAGRAARRVSRQRPRGRVPGLAPRRHRVRAPELPRRAVAEGRQGTGL